jgi:glutaredoxin 3
MKAIEIYTTDTCPYCVRAKMLLDKKGASYKEIRVDLNENLRNEMISRSGRRTVPQIFIDGKAIGGCDDLYALEANHQLDELLK